MGVNRAGFYIEIQIAVESGPKKSTQKAQGLNKRKMFGHNKQKQN